MSEQAAIGRRSANGTFRCQFCGGCSPEFSWVNDRCLICGRVYSWLLAQDEETD